jgi:hypothetical protein
MLLRGESLEGAIAATVAYFDVFAFAPDAGQIHRFLLGHQADREQVERALTPGPKLLGIVDKEDGFYFLRGKGHLALRRLRFRRHSERLWRRAEVMARIIERSGLALSGLVTGSLASDNADEHADVDFLFIYPAARTWTSYALVRAAARIPPLRGLCANYVLSDASLEIRPQNLFTALEIAKAVPMFGLDVYQRFIGANLWVDRFLPNAFERAHSIPEPSANGHRLLETRAFRAIESWEKRRKFGADRRDVGVDMDLRERQGSMDRHSPTRSLYALCELRYRMQLLGLEAHPLYDELAGSAVPLSGEMKRWGTEAITSSDARSPESAP